MTFLAAWWALTSSFTAGYMLGGINGDRELEAREEALAAELDAAHRLIAQLRCELAETRISAEAAEFLRRMV